MAKDSRKSSEKLLRKAEKAARKAQEAAERAEAAAATPAAAPAPAGKAGLAVSPLAPAGFPELPVIAGVEFAAGAAGVKYKDRTDVMLVRLAPGTAIAGAFTRSSTRAACVLDCQGKLSGNPESDQGAAILVNSGNANAFTGAAGQRSVDAVTGAVV